MSVSESEQPSGSLRRVVSDTGPMISLERLTGGFRFIRRLYDRMIVPPAVLEELGFGYDRAEEYLEHYGIDDLIEVRSVDSQAELPDLERLHEGEIQAIRLALELGLPLLIEEAAGRRSAQAAGVSISGVAGQVVKAHRQGGISVEKARAMLKEMVEHRRINERIYEQLVAALECEA